MVVAAAGTSAANAEVLVGALVLFSKAEGVLLAAALKVGCPNLNY
jgi:hypothetical protein